MQVPSLKTLACAVVALALLACMYMLREKGQPPSAIEPPTLTATQGAPSAAHAKEPRLLAVGCDGQEAMVRARIVHMHLAVDEEFQAWQDTQPTCWAEARQREKEIQERGEKYAPGLGPLWIVGHSRLAASAQSMSRTNNQVANVDEADLVRTDGRFVYIAANGALRILEALNPRVVSVTPLPDVLRELFVEGDRAVVFTVADDGASTRIHVLDISDRNRPTSMREIELSGSLIASRRIGTTVHTVVADDHSATGDYATWPSDVPKCGMTESAVRERLAQLKIENEGKIREASALPTMRDRGSPTLLCTGLYDSQLDRAHSFTTMVSFDIADEDVAPTTTTVRSRPGAVFASGGALYIATARQEVSDVHKFHIGAHPDETRYVGSGVVPGHGLNQFAMDEWHGYLRIATTRGEAPDHNVGSTVSILEEREDGNLVRVGAVDHIAPGEDIRAVRFDDERAYVVTFKKTDPLFVLDLRDVARPAIVGELKIPGFSTYLHRMDEGHLVSIGFDADEVGDRAYVNGVLLQIFDVTNPAKPKLLHKEKLGTRGSSSTATSNHLAFDYFAEKGLLAIPMTICENRGGQNGKRVTFSGLLVYRVHARTGFERLGGVDHSRSAVVRSIFVDDLVYSMALDRMKVQRMPALGIDMADIALTP